VSSRHCCLCGMNVGVGIEVAHLDPAKSDFDNAIPLCFECHAKIGHYNPRHPRGRKYSIPELKARREQVYEQHTRQFVPPVQYRLTQSGRELPDVGFVMHNMGDTYPVRARVVVTLSQSDRNYGTPETTGHYNGMFLWNLNPRSGVKGHFQAPEAL